MDYDSRLSRKPYSSRNKYENYQKPVNYKYDSFNNKVYEHADRQYRMLQKSQEMASECHEQLSGRASGSVGWSKLRNYWLGEVGNELLRWQYMTKGYVDYHRMLKDTENQLHTTSNDLKHAENELTRQRDDHTAAIEHLHKNYDGKLNDIETQWNDTLKQREIKHERDVSELERNLRQLRDERMHLEDKLNQTTSEMQRELDNMDNKHRRDLDTQMRSHEQELGRMQSDNERLSSDLSSAQRDLQNAVSDKQRELTQALQAEDDLKKELEYAQRQMDEIDSTHRANMRHKDDQHKEEKRKIYEENRMTLLMLEDELTANTISARGWKKVREAFMRNINKEMRSWVSVRNAIVHVSGDLRRKLRLQERDLSDAVDELAYTQNEFDEKMRLQQREADDERKQSLQSIKDLERELDFTRTKTNQFERDIENLTHKNDVATRQADQYLHQLQDSERDHEQKMSELEHLKQENERLISNLESAERDLKARDAEIHDRSKELQDMALENEEYRRKLRDNEIELEKRERLARDEAKRVKVYEDMLYEKEREVDNFRHRENQLESEFLEQLKTHEKEQGELNNTLGLLKEEAEEEKQRRERFRRQSKTGFGKSYF